MFWVGQGGLYCLFFEITCIDSRPDKVVSLFVDKDNFLILVTFFLHKILLKLWQQLSHLLNFKEEKIEIKIKEV